MEPAQPFSPPESRTKRRVASRMLSAQIATFAVIVATAVALIVYFATRPA